MAIKKPTVFNNTKLKAFFKKGSNRRIGTALVALFVVGSVGYLGTQMRDDSRAATPGTMYASPASSTLTSGATVSVAIYEESGTTSVNSVQSQLNYDATKLQFVSITEGTAFPFVAATSTSTPGQIRVARGTKAGDPGMAGNQLLVTVNFKVLATSGTTSVSFDNNFSLIVRASDQTNMMTGSIGATYSVVSPTPSTMYVLPASGTMAPGSTVAVAIRENSSSTINSVQAQLNYNTSQLQFVSITEGTTFPFVAATSTATAGQVRIARGVNSGKPGISGDNLVVTVNFKVIAASGASTTLSFDSANTLLVRSSDAANVLTSTTGATYSVSNPAPAITSISPTNGPAAGGTTVTITGTNFVSGATVMFGSSAATSVTYVSATTLRAVTPSQPTGGVKDLRVTNPNGQTVTKTAAYTYAVPVANPPALSSLSTKFGFALGGKVVTLAGSNFVSGATVKFGGTSATRVTFVSGSSLSVVAPAHAVGAVSVVVTNPDGQSATLSNVYTYRMNGDANSDNKVNGIDYSILSGRDGSSFADADFNADNVVGAADLAIILANWTW